MSCVGCACALFGFSGALNPSGVSDLLSEGLGCADVWPGALVSVLVTVPSGRLVTVTVLEGCVAGLAAWPCGGLLVDGCTDSDGLGCCVLYTLPCRLDVGCVLWYWVVDCGLDCDGCLETDWAGCLEGWVLAACGAPPTLWADAANMAAIAIIVRISLFILSIFFLY